MTLRGNTVFRRFWKSLSPFVTAAAFLLVWEVGVWVFSIPHYLLPPPSVVLDDLVTRWPRISEGISITAIEIVLGYAIAVVVSVPIALAIAFSPWIERHIYPAIVTFTIIPMIAIAPLFVIWFGVGLMPKLLLVFLLSFFPMLVNDIAGFRSVTSEILDFAKSTGAGRLKQFWKIRLPASLPFVFTGMKIAASNAATAAVVAEFVASDQGLGYLLLEYNGNLETSAVFATIMILSCLGLSLYYLIAFIERITIPWHVSQIRLKAAA